MLRYILFHHQTTTYPLGSYSTFGCVISSFITKPQLAGLLSGNTEVALYPLSSPNHNPKDIQIQRVAVALYPLSSPNHNSNIKDISL